MELLVVPVENPGELNLVLGQSHFIKTVEDLHEVLAGSSPGTRFGLAFCESSGPRLLRQLGNDDDLEQLAIRNTLAIGAGHSFIVSYGTRSRSTCSTPSSRCRRSAIFTAPPPTPCRGRGRDRGGAGHPRSDRRGVARRRGERRRYRRPQKALTDAWIQALEGLRDHRAPDFSEGPSVL